MPAIGKVAQELAESIVKKAPQRTEFKTLKEIPDEVKALEPEARQIESDKILDADMTDEFMGVRQQDIKADKGYTAQQRLKVEEKIEDRKRKSAKFKKIIDDTPEILDAKTYKKLETSTSFYESSEIKLQKLNERQRDLYLKANNLQKEQSLVSQMQTARDNGVSTVDSIYDIISSRVGVGGVNTNIEGRTAAIYNRVNAGMYELKEAFRTKNFGLSQNVEMMHETLRYLKHGKVKNQKMLADVKQVADQWTKAADTIKAMRNKAGARVGKLEDWLIPQSHDTRKIRASGAKQWKKSIINKLDRTRIESEQGRPLEDVLDSAYKNITSPKVETSTGRNGSVIAKRHEESRVLHFKDAEDMITYNNEFGNPDMFATMDAHIRQQSNEIAMMQILGSNPESAYNKLKELARADGMGTKQETLLDMQWKVSSGLADGDGIVDAADSMLASIGGGYRSLQVASKLGSATVSSLADLGNIVLGSNYRNLNSVKILGRGLQTLLQEVTSVGKVGKNTELANRIGVVSEFANASLANSRFAESTGSGMLQKSAEVVIRASGLGSYTNSLRASFGLELAANLAENFNKKLDDVPFANMLKEYGIDNEAWEIVRKTKPRDIKNSKFLDMDTIYEADEELGYKISEMITNEMNSFIVMPGDRVRKWTTAGMKKGTMGGEAARALTLFKSFPVAVTMMHLNRFGKIEGTIGKAAYAGKLIGSNLIMGTMTLWAYDTVTGKSARSIDRPAMIGEALTKSGGLGIFGDFFIGMADTKYGSSFSDILMGVPASTISDIVKTAQDLGTKDTDKALGNVYNRAKSYIPGQNLWYTRTLMERTIGDFLNDAVDPDYHKRLRRRDKALRLRDQELLFK